jgi:hypothetical protein
MTQIATRTTTEYDRRLAPARARLAHGRLVTEILAPNVDADLLERFLIAYCALGVQMTEPVEGWIRRAGERCVAVGEAAIGRALVRHARAEAGHDRMLADDARTLAQRRQRHGRVAPDVEALLAHAATPAIRRYVELHEATIAGPTPCAQIAVELEVENLSTVHGPAFIARCTETLGGDVRAGLTFLHDHVELDVGHTRFNRAQLTRLLERRPELLAPLVAAGTEALAAYGDFLDECIDRVRKN